MYEHMVARVDERRHRWSSLGSMSDPLLPTSLDHVALWVADRDAIAALACDHLGMHVIERTDTFTLVGADARRGKLTLFDAPGPREPGALEAIILRVNDLDAALEALPSDLEVSMRPEGVATFRAPEGLTLGLAERETDVDYDLDHVVLRVPDVESSAAAFSDLGFERDGTKLSVAGKWVRLVDGGEEEGERPLLNHLAVLVDSAEDAERSARELGVEVADVVDAPNTLAVFVWTPGRIKLEYEEHKPSFSLV
jgi:catechol 2,3-dioxygenase-like lactoylglutathione lyase family enzyme